MTFKHTNTTPAPEYFVFYSEANAEDLCPSVTISELEPGSTIASGQPNHAQFSSYAEAEQFAMGLGYEPPEPAEPAEPPLLPLD